MPKLEIEPIDLELPTEHKCVQEKGSLFILKHAERRVIIPTPASYTAALDAVYKHFPHISRERTMLQTDELDVSAGEMVEIAPHSWEKVVGLISSITVTETALPTPVGLPLVSDAPNGSQSKNGKIEIRIIGPTTTMSMRVSPSTTIDKIISTVASSSNGGLELDGCVARFDNGRPVRHGSGLRVQDLKLEDGDEIFLSNEQIGRKPVIYLFSPTELDVSVTLSLAPEWSFSVLYPVVPTKASADGQGDCVQWNVRTRSDGTLTETNTCLDVAYLFWEAHTNLERPITPPLSPTPFLQDFNPVSSTVHDADSVLLHVPDMTTYLDNALKALGLHTEARTSFITYWLPSFLKHTHVALRFLPQEAYSRAARLDVRPAPDVVTRIFMLFKGISRESLGDWPEATARAGAGVGLWREVVGGDLLVDAKLFRVLEWGGMEVFK